MSRFLWFTVNECHLDRQMFAVSVDMNFDGMHTDIELRCSN